MKNKVFMFLIVFSLIVGFLGSVYANYDGSTASVKAVPTILKITGNLSLSSNDCTTQTCNLTINLNGTSLITPISGYASDLSNKLNSGIFVGPFSSSQTLTTNKNYDLFVSVVDGSNKTLITTDVNVPNPNYNTGYLLADNVADNAITTSKLAYSSVTMPKFDTTNQPDPGISVINYDATTNELSWNNNIASLILDGSITNNMLADNSITGSKVSPGSLDESDVAMRTYLKLNPQQSAPVTCDASTVGLMYILRTNHTDNPSTYSDKICVYDSGTTTHDIVYCWKNSSTNVCDNPSHNCDACTQNQDNQDTCIKYDCTTQTGAGYQWMDID